MPSRTPTSCWCPRSPSTAPVIDSVAVVVLTTARSRGCRQPRRCSPSSTMTKYSMRCRANRTTDRSTACSPQAACFTSRPPDDPDHMSATRLDLVLLLGALVLLAAIRAVRFANRIGLPGLLVYLAIGLALQSLVSFDDTKRAQSLGLAALVLILAEGGITTRWNDAPAVIAVVLLSSKHPQHNAGLIALLVAYELVAGAAIGYVVAWLGVHALRRLALPASGLYPLAVLALAVAGFATSSLAHASGFLSVYVAGLVLGNSKLPHRPATRSFAEGVAWLAQIGLFVMLGLLVTPSALPREILPAIAVGAALLLVARPASVAISLLPLQIQRWRPLAFNRPERLFLSWAGLRGAVPIVLATVPVTAGVAHSGNLFGLVFVLVVVFTLVQGPTLPAVARVLKLTGVGEPGQIDVEAAPLEDLHADLLQLVIPPGSQLHGVEIFELRLPRGSAVTLVVRDGVSFVPTGETQLREGDSLLIVATAAARGAAERRLRAVSRRGKLAGWFGDRGV